MRVTTPEQIGEFVPSVLEAGSTNLKLLAVQPGLRGVLSELTWV